MKRAESASMLYCYLHNCTKEKKRKEKKSYLQNCIYMFLYIKI